MKELKRRSDNNYELEELTDEDLITEDDNFEDEDFNDLYSKLEEDNLKKEDNHKEIKHIKKKKGNKKILILLILFLIILVSLYIICIPKIKLNGDKEISFTVNSEYKEFGATAKFIGKDVTKKIKIDGKVDTSKVGSYTLTYSIKKLFITRKVKRTVKIVDNGPIITLEGDKNYSICPNKDYEEIGFKANTIAKGEISEDDLSSSVETKIEKDVVNYNIKDKNGTMFYITRNLIREDKQGPEIKLNGSDHIYVTLGFNFNDPKANVNDNCDGDLTDKLEISGNVDTNTLGDYEISYKIKDNASNETEVKRTVTVQKEIVKRNASLGCGEAGVIYLTFDDGPAGGTTSTILDILKRQGVKATFFVTNSNGGSDDLIKRAFDEGHLIALHTSSHEYSQVYKSMDAYYADLNKISERVERITGKKSYFIRFPGGSSNTVSRRYSNGIMSMLVNDVESKGYSYYDWNVDSRDAEGKNCEQVYHYATSGFSKSSGNVVLMHDIKTSTACALERVIEYGKNNGYTFKTLDSGVVCHHKTAN